MRVGIRGMAVVFVLGAGIADAQTIDPALTAAIAGRDKAVLARDAATVGRYTADDFIAVNPSGALTTKQERVDGLKRPATPSAQPGQPLRTEAVRMYGPNAAVARLKAAADRQISVWVKGPAGWQVEAIHIVPDALLPMQPPADRPKTAPASNVPTPAGLTGDKAAVFRAFKQIQDAFFAGDRATYERLTAPEHVRLSPGIVRFAHEGSVTIDGPRTPPTYANVSVHVWDQLGLVRWHETNAAGQQQWLTRVFAKTGSEWRQVATASSLAARPQ